MLLLLTLIYYNNLLTLCVKISLNITQEGWQLLLRLPWIICITLILPKTFSFARVVVSRISSGKAFIFDVFVLSLDNWVMFFYSMCKSVRVWSLNKNHIACYNSPQSTVEGKQSHVVWAFTCIQLCVLDKSIPSAIKMRIGYIIALYC